MQIIPNYSLDHYNTLALKANADKFCILNSTNELIELSILIQEVSKYMILGGGSNVLFPAHYSGLVIFNALKGIEFKEYGRDHYLLTAYAGELWDNLVATALNNKAYGLENLSFIPGTVGASPIQNIGAYGVEVKDFIFKVTCFNLITKQIIDLNNQECQFKYRDSLFKKHPELLVIKVSFKLAKTPKLSLQYGDIQAKASLISNPTPFDLRKIIIATRINKLPDPNLIPNVGSFFHNPIITKTQLQALLSTHKNLVYYPTKEADLVKASAGWLIDNLGLKGYSNQYFATFKNQALVIINNQPFISTQKEVLEFANFIQNKVLQNYQIQLKIEPIIL